MNIMLLRTKLFTAMLAAGALLAACGSAPATGDQARTSQAPAAVAQATAAPSPTAAPTATIAPSHTPTPAPATAAPSPTAAPAANAAQSTPAEAHSHATGPAASGTPNQSSAGVQVQADIKLFQFKPNPLEVPLGATVTWTNQDDIEHSVTHGTPEAPGGAFDSGLFGKGTTYSFTFTKPGEYMYFCTRHTSMQGRVNVTSVASGDTPSVAEARAELAPPDQLVIPAINLDVKPVSVGLDQNHVPVVPRHDVGWFSDSARPGQGSNVIFWGHVLRWKETPARPAPFERLHELRPGAEIIVVSQRQPRRYKVTEQIQVRPESVAYLLPTAEERLTFVSCIGDNVIVTGTLTKEFRLVTIAEPMT